MRHVQVQKCAHLHMLNISSNIRTLIRYLLDMYVFLVHSRFCGALAFTPRNLAGLPVDCNPGYSLHTGNLEATDSQAHQE